MKIGLVYAMTGEIESLLTQENAQPLQTVAGVPFYRIRPDVIACAGGVSKVNAAMATQLLISLYQPDLVIVSYSRQMLCANLYDMMEGY